MRSMVRGVMAAVVLSFAGVAAAEVTSGPQVGETVGAFEVTKVAGNPDDGVADGRKLCYRCKMGARPVVMLFARTADDRLAKLLKKLDEELDEHKDDKLSGFVNMIGADEAALKKAAAEFATKHGIKRIAFVVPEDAKNGPENLKIAPDADLTVVCYKEGTVKANQAFAKGGLSDEKIDAVVKASCTLVE
jgi:hypothetical protein